MPALMTAGTLALALTACGGGAPEEEPADAAAETPEESSGGGILDLVASLGQSFQEVDNYTLDMEMVASDPEEGDTTMTTTYEVMDDPEAAHVTMVMPFVGEAILGLAELSGEDLGLTAEELGTSILIVPAEGDVLVSNHNGLQEVDTPWVRGVQDTETAPSDEVFDTSHFPRIAGTVAEIEQIEEVGTEEVSGVETTLVEGTLTQEEVEALEPEQKKAVNELMGGSIEGTVEVSAWIADDGFPMRMEFSDDVADVSMVFSDLGETSFEMPSEDEITDL
ncbi:hypothetical protein A6A08_00645 [Nocardiopsis sp. TSRI0078]|nr:hypothetical protein A6A08_00645 [Nocardiopsis sp. TSRI0078]